MSHELMQLSEAQKRCLRLVAKGFTSKEIAQQTDLSPLTVDQYLSRATGALSASNRRDAARKLAHMERKRQFRQTEFKSESLAQPAITHNAEPATPPSETDRFFLGLPPLGGRLNTLGWLGKTDAIMRIGFVSASSVIALVLVIRAALNTFQPG